MRIPGWLGLAVLISLTPGLRAAAEMPPEPPPPVPSDVQLRNGVVLHRVTVVRWEKDRVVLKHAGGADPIRYIDLADSQKQMIMARGQYELNHPAAPPGAMAAAEPAASQSIIYKGEVSLPQTNGVYKFNGADVYAFPLSAMAAFGSNLETIDVPKPLAQAKTDSHGNFILTVPVGTPHFIYCQGERNLPTGSERCAWRIETKDIKDPVLIAFNTRFRAPPKRLRIAE